MNSAVISTPVGNVLIEVIDEKVTEIRFTEEKPRAGSAAASKMASEQLREYFAGERQEFSFEIQPTGTDFQQKVWLELQNIPFGKTISYQELANRLGDPKCIRAAAAANGKNPLAIVVPCHRVIGADGSMTGYAGGLERKKELLRLERAEIMSQTDLFK